jgi:DNA polymerase-2
MNFKKTLFNNTVIKVFIEKLSFRYKLLNDNKKRTELETKIKHNSYMLDVSPELKYFNESKKFQWSQDRHILYFDIETWYDPKIPDANKPQIAMKPITSIQLYSTLSNEYFILVWHPSFKHNKKDVLNEIIKIEGIELNVIKCKTELLMYQSFINLFRMLNPDIISGWYSNGYDVPYLINRASVLGIANEFKRISPGKWISSKYNSIKRVFYNTIKGVDHVDMMDAVQSLNIKLPNNKLNTAAEIILGSDMTKIKTSSWKDWDTDLDGFIKYGFRDVQILKEIDQKLDIFNFFYNIQDITNITQLKQKFTQTVLIDNFLTSRYFDKNKIFPTNIRAEKVEFMGAFVKQPVAV